MMRCIHCGWALDDSPLYDKSQVYMRCDHCKQKNLLVNLHHACIEEEKKHLTIKACVKCRRIMADDKCAVCDKQDN